MARRGLRAEGRKKWKEGRDGMNVLKSCVESTGTGYKKRRIIKRKNIYGETLK